MMGYRQTIALLVVLGFALGYADKVVGSPWGAEYFPNTELVTHDGETVRFFDDLVKDKVVAINFIYTSCPDVCPLETAQLTQVQRILGDRLGKDVFFYSISIDPEIDTPEVLHEYRARFGANWTFLTGDEDEIVELRRKLGLYVEEIQDGSNNHNVNMIIGNQATGRWMKRSPFENPHVLADQIGNWLHGWKAPPVQQANYADAPELRSISKGEQLFRTRCTSCHTISGKEPEDALGPDLIGVTAQRDPEWLLNWLRAPDQMLRDEDPTAMALLEKYNGLPMPNLRLNRKEVDYLLEYIATETERLERVARQQEPVPSIPGTPDEDVVAVMNAWIRATDPGAKANAGYMTLINLADNELRLMAVNSPAFDSVEMHEMGLSNGMMKMSELDFVAIPPNGQARFKPGGQHLMMHGPAGGHLPAGETVDMTLEFDNGQQQTITVKVIGK